MPGVFLAGRAAKLDAENLEFSGSSRKLLNLLVVRPSAQKERVNQ